MQSRCRFFAVLAAVLVAACGESLGPNISGVPAMGITSVRITPSVDTLVLGDTLAPSSVQLVAEAIGRANQVISNLRYVWWSTNDKVAVVDSLGVVKALTPGSTEIWASAGRQAHATIVVTGTAPSLSLVPR